MIVVCVEIMNKEIIGKGDLPREQNEIGSMWSLYSKSNLLASDGVFGNYWVITKNSSGGSSEYEFYCGENVKWPLNRIPQMVFIMENNIFKGILVNGSISKLIMKGEKVLNNWYKPVFDASVPSTGAYIMAGGSLLSVPAGMRMHHVDHRTGKVTEISNPTPKLMTATHRLTPNPTLYHTPRMDIMSAVNHPGVTLGDIGKNLHLLRFG